MNNIAQTRNQRLTEDLPVAYLKVGMITTNGFRVTAVRKSLEKNSVNVAYQKYDDPYTAFIEDYIFSDKVEVLD